MSDDLISRAAALDALNGLTEIYLNNLPPTIYKEDAIKAVKALPPAHPSVSKTEIVEDTISRQAAIDALYHVDEYNGRSVEVIRNLPSAQPEIIKCKDCKRWRDSDGVYRRGTDAESKCPLNTKEVYAGTFYCGYAERRTDERTD